VTGFFEAVSVLLKNAPVATDELQRAVGLKPKICDITQDEALASKPENDMTYIQMSTNSHATQPSQLKKVKGKVSPKFDYKVVCAYTHARQAK